MNDETGAVNAETGDLNDEIEPVNEETAAGAEVWELSFAEASGQGDLSRTLPEDPGIQV